jgi:hypothetical protein
MVLSLPERVAQLEAMVEANSKNVDRLVNSIENVRLSQEKMLKTIGRLSFMGPFLSAALFVIGILVGAGFHL